MKQNKETKNKIVKIRLIPEELEGIVNDMYEIFQGDEYAFVEDYPEYTHHAIKKCWKKNNIGVYEPSPFEIKGKRGKQYMQTAKYLGKNNGKIRRSMYARD